MINDLIEAFTKLEAVEAIALGGSRAADTFDEASDYDVYLYITEPIQEKARQKILSQYCSYMEIGNHFWEYEDNCTLKNGIDIDILYRNLDDFCKEVERVVVDCQPANAYTTCMWHNLLYCKIMYDKNGRFQKAQNKFTVPYPKALKKAIIQRQLQLMDSAMPAYKIQIEKAIKRKDFVSVNHRVTEFLASYFDLLFALNEKTHSGEKRLITLCCQNCTILPKNFEKNLNELFAHLFEFQVIDNIYHMIEEVKRIL